MQTTPHPTLQPTTSCCVVEAKHSCPNAVCCEDGAWTCSGRDGSICPIGQVCNKCCIDHERPPCPIGDYFCCSDGTWQCPNPSSGLYSCGKVQVKRPQGHICCCDRNSEFSCPLGPAIFCGDGTWQCPDFSTCLVEKGEACRQTGPWKYVEPVRWKSVSKGKNVRQCIRRRNAPVDGSTCWSEDKTCFFGTVMCNVNEYRPVTKCDCYGIGRKKGTWSCQDIPCSASQS